MVEKTIIYLKDNSEFDASAGRLLADYERPSLVIRIRDIYMLERKLCERFMRNIVSR